MSNSVAIKVAEQIKTIAPQVEAAVVDALVSRELTKRSEALVKTIDALAKLEQEHRKFKPDLIAHDDNGAVVSQAWSKAKLEERNKSQQKIDKHTKAINKALDGDFSDVYNLGNTQSQGGGASKPATDSGDAE